jgi:hypothetical protein
MFAILTKWAGAGGLKVTRPENQARGVKGPAGNLRHDDLAAHFPTHAPDQALPIHLSAALVLGRAEQIQRKSQRGSLLRR